MGEILKPNPSVQFKKWFRAETSNSGLREFRWTTALWAIKESGAYVWFWIGEHKLYDLLIRCPLVPGKFSSSSISGDRPKCTLAQRMWQTCLYAGSMSKMVQIRDVPDDIHGILKGRAAREGMSLSDFLKRELERTALRPSMREWLELTQQAKPIRARRSPARLVRELRNAR